MELKLSAIAQELEDKVYELIQQVARHERAVHEHHMEEAALGMI